MSRLFEQLTLITGPRSSFLAGPLGVTGEIGFSLGIRDSSGTRPVIFGLDLMRRTRRPLAVATAA